MPKKEKREDTRAGQRLGMYTDPFYRTSPRELEQVLTGNITPVELCWVPTCDMEDNQRVCGGHPSVSE